ncbi:hypothetical protein FRB96_009480 [Tulasnella sp. 330]|nr:hypothetical protein FRB96_009480 [Tulasnella sp. 330]KAG8875700.1 hypothetical protein FRB97_004803 [Tulasnella sp. 331]
MATLSHPNLPNLIGRSTKNVSSPFTVFSDFTRVSMRGIFQETIQKGPVKGFMFALSFMQGVASAIQYLSSDLRVGTPDLRSCMEVGNLRLSSRGKVVVGGGFILSQPTTFYELDLSKWLMRRFWCMTHEILYGSEDPIDDTNWGAIRRMLDKHVQPLSTLIAYDCPNFAYMTRRLSGILGPLDAVDRSPHRELTYSDIRRQLLRAPLAHLCFLYRPPKAIDISLGDIGYMNGNSFVKLANIKDDATISIVSNGNVDYVHSAPPDIQSERLGDGTIKHSFRNPIHSNIVRQGDAEHIEHITALWPHFIRRAPEIAKGARALRAEDLILIASIQKGWRGTRLECKPDEHRDPAASFIANFIEPLELPEGREWGTWIVDGFEIKDPMRKLEDEWTMTPNGYCIRMKMTRYPQRIEFMQLSWSDCSSDET